MQQLPLTWPDTPASWRIGSTLRRLRLASGLVLFTYVATHLINHALCNASVPAADALLLVQKFVWQGALGTVALYGALLVHMALGFHALYARRHFRWTRAEAVQLAMGLAFPALIANHIAVTRTALALYGLNKGYIAELASLWVKSPQLGLLQMAVLVAAWTHGCIGLHFIGRLRRWYAPWQPILLAAALLLPALAALGYVQGGREIARALAEPGFRAAHLGPSVTGTAAQSATLATYRDDFLYAYAALLAAILLARLIRRLLELRRGLITIFYPDGARVRVAPGTSILEASALGHMPHAAVCGGRGRCSTCRVLVVFSQEKLPPPAWHERRLLRQIGAEPARIRLACQVRPVGDLQVVPLIPPAFARQHVAGGTARMPEQERFIAAMFIDLRGSTAMVERRTPYDSVFLLGRFIDGVSRSVAERGGRPVQFLGDGVLALFGLDCDPQEACRQALAAASDMPGELEEVSALFQQEGAGPLRFGVGLHCGRAIVGEITMPDHIAFTALGETINIAHRLQEYARDTGVFAAISDEVFEAADADTGAYTRSVTVLKGRTASIGVWTKEDFFLKKEAKTFLSAVADSTG